MDAYALVNYGKMIISGGKVEDTVLNFIIFIGFEALINPYTI